MKVIRVFTLKNYRYVLSVFIIFMSFGSEFLLADASEDLLNRDVLDGDVHELLISVRQESNQNRQQGMYYFNGENSLDVHEGKKNITRHYRSYDPDSSSQKIRVTEGYVAMFYVKKEIQTPVISSDYEGFGISGIQYKEIKTGFYVKAIVIGDKARVTIKPFKEGLSKNGGSTIVGTESKTTMTVPLGEWVDIAGVNNTKFESRSGRVIGTRDQDHVDDVISLKVDLSH